jgi:hypothetical protein
MTEIERKRKRLRRLLRGEDKQGRPIKMYLEGLVADEIKKLKKELASLDK